MRAGKSCIGMMAIPVAFVCVLGSELRAQQTLGHTALQETRAQRPSSDVSDSITANAVCIRLTNDGIFSRTSQLGGRGFEWPRGSGKGLIFMDGLLYAGTVAGVVHVGGSTYRSGLQAGPIDSVGRPADPTDPTHRIYKIRRLKRSSLALLPFVEQQRLRADFNEWPVSAGAPFLDSDHNGRYDPNFDAWLNDSSSCDKPFFLGDEFLYFISNDMDTSRTLQLYGTRPVGLEIHTMAWAYNRSGPLQNTVFVKHILINKSRHAFEDVALGRWMDPDLGDASDDLDGIDTIRNMAFVYNGAPRDLIYGIPPVLGVRMLQGPAVRAPGRTAVHGFGKRAEMKNLPLSSYVHFVNLDASFPDPQLGEASSAMYVYNYFRSRTFRDSPIIDPTNGKEVRFCNAGDPVRGEGWIDGRLHPPGDRRTLMGSALFTMQPGDTQEVAYGYIVAQGGSVKDGIRLLRAQSDVVQHFYNNLDRSDSTPDVTAIVSYPYPDSTRVTIRGTFPAAVSATAFFVRGDGTVAGRVDLVDDGRHGDGAGGDHVFAHVWTTARSPEGVDCAVTVTSAGAWTDGVSVATCMPFAGPVRAFVGKVESDHLNFDYSANPGENIRLSVGVVNASAVPLGPWTVSNNGFGNGTPEFARLQSVLDGGDSAATAYSAEDIHSRLETDVPVSATDGEQLRLPVFVEEANNNCWCDTLTVTVRGLAVPVVDSFTVHTAGPATGTFGWRLVHPDSSVEHCYRITIRGSAYDERHTVRITDLTLPKVLLDGAALPTAHAHEFPVVDGWKLTLGSIVENQLDSISDTWQKEHDGMFTSRYMPLENRWYSGRSIVTTASEWGWGSSLKLFEYIPVILVFDTRFPQKAYLFLRGGTPTYSCTAYTDIPVRAYDVSNPAAPRQIGLAFVENNGGPRQNGTWDPATFDDREFLFVLKSTYSEHADPAMLSKQINTDAKTMPLLYAAWLERTSPRTGFVDGDSLLFVQRVPVTDLDTFYIHPSAPRITIPLPGVPTLIAPAHKAVDVPLDTMLRWSSVSGSEFYLLRMQQDGYGVHEWQCVDTTFLPPPYTGTRYYWRVQACNAAGNGPWSTEREFVTVQRVAAPMLLSPVDKSLIPVVDTILAWSAVTGAGAYRVQLADNSAFATPWDSSGVTGTAIAVRNLRRGQSYWWRVNAASAAGPGGWSPVWTFSTEKATGNDDAISVRPAFEVVVTPQPARSMITVAFRGAAGGTVHLTLVDVLGRTVARWSTSGDAPLQISIDGVPPGTYVMHAATRTQSVTRRLIVERAR